MDTTYCNSPEFEFWKFRNPSFPQPNLLSADELFVDGVLLPLHLLSVTNKPDPQPRTSQKPVQHSEPGSGPDSSSSSSATSSESKRWKDIFRKTEKNNSTEEKEKENDKGKKKERRSGSGASVAELNINIWPFSRSRSAGNSVTRPKLFTGAPVTRKVNSAPCSRSNSTGESKYRKLPSSPGRAGVHVGRSSPVWQVRRGATAAKKSEPEALNGEKGSKIRDTATSRWSKVSGSGKARVLNLNVPTCIGYRHNLSCRSNENGGVGASGATTTNGGDDRNGGNLFNLRSLFTKKSIVTSH
ncbi:PREDICTED: uncharacterized protein LOC109345350 isoform X2 [Lupinus angustifolius]|uniref:uncharacterized protein LOC109345350 isoform X2 n=1 Tax=Lupinus angustifolius TaxID=3871 RepID=UPI00092F04A6|nr:PREDICTED: uncharacterized protein LOC109345350 isoform X2 [Lupinus angustifolius]